MRSRLIAEVLIRTMVVRDQHGTGGDPVKRAYESAAHVHHREHELAINN